MGIKNLPGAGTKFTSYAFKRKMGGLVQGGKSNLAPYKKDIIETVSRHKTYIKRGGLSRQQRISAWQKIKKSNPNISNESARDIKKILEHLSGGAKATQGAKLQEQLKAKEQKSQAELRKKQILKSQMQRDVPSRETISREYKISAGIAGRGARPDPGAKNQSGFASSPGKGSSFASPPGGAGGRPSIPLQR